VSFAEVWGLDRILGGLSWRGLRVGGVRIEEKQSGCLGRDSGGPERIALFSFEM